MFWEQIWSTNEEKLFTLILAGDGWYVYVMNLDKKIKSWLIQIVTTYISGATQKLRNGYSGRSLSISLILLTYV